MEEDIKYCVTAFIDLLGFSSHLDVSSNDLRTNIGQEAIKRLTFLEDSLAKIEDAIKLNKEFFPESLYYQRINDGLIVTIDLPELLKPSIGEAHKNGLSVDEFGKYFDVEKLPTFEDAKQAYSEKIDESVESLCKFVGMVSRIHNFINKQETRSFFPGAKTVIATGFRKIFINRNGAEDFLAANFSFSNAYKAEQMLHGSKIYIDCYILQLLSNNKYSRNIVKSAIFVSNSKPLDPFTESEDYFILQTEKKRIDSNIIKLIS